MCCSLVLLSHLPYVQQFVKHCHLQVKCGTAAYEIPNCAKLWYRTVLNIINPGNFTVPVYCTSLTHTCTHIYCTLQNVRQPIRFKPSTAPLNLIGWRTFWGVQLFSGKRTVNVVPGSSLDRVTVPYHFAKWFLLFQRSYNIKITKTHNDTGQTNKYSKQKDKIDKSCPCFCHKIKFYYVRKAHTLLSLSRSRSLPQRHTYSLHTP